MNIKTEVLIKLPKNDYILDNMDYVYHINHDGSINVWKDKNFIHSMTAMKTVAGNYHVDFDYPYKYNKNYITRKPVKVGGVVVHNPDKQLVVHSSTESTKLEVLYTKDNLIEEVIYLERSEDDMFIFLFNYIEKNLYVYSAKNDTIVIPLNTSETDIMLMYKDTAVPKDYIERKNYMNLQRHSHINPSGHIITEFEI